MEPTLKAGTMPGQTQISVAENFFQKAFHGEIADTLEVLDQNVAYHVPGKSRIAGTFVGPDAVVEHVASLLKLTATRVDIIQWEDWLAGVNSVAGVVHLRIQREGAIADTRMIYLFALTDQNKIRRIDVFFGDQAAIDRFFV
jgi:ketosteroid isomerase-like protein